MNVKMFFGPNFHRKRLVFNKSAPVIGRQFSESVPQVLVRHGLASLASIMLKSSLICCVKFRFMNLVDICVRAILKGLPVV
jgi:hypothetical protein